MILYIPDNPPIRPDCFVIPSYAVVDRNTPTRPTREQIDLAILWWQRFPHASLIMSTGDNQRLGITNARVMADYAAAKGVPRGNIVEEDRSKNTWENLLYSMDIIHREGWRQPTLVTIDLYTPRAVATAKKQGWRDFCWLSIFSKGEPAYGWKRIQTRSRLTIFCYELGATFFSRLVGWV